MYPELKPYVVLITGGASGLGLAAAQGFAKEGATVVIADLQEAAATRVAQQLGAQHLGLACDVAQEAQVNHVVDTVIKKYGRVDVLINCAGIADQVKPTVEQDMVHFRRLLDIHLTGTYMMTKACAVHMLKQGKGNVINVSSIAGVIGLTYRNAYSAAKAAISMITRTLGCEWAAAGIRVNAIAPGWIETAMSAKAFAGDPARLQKVLGRTPMAKLGKPEDIGWAAVYLASEAASFVTGVVFPVDGGASIGF